MSDDPTTRDSNAGDASEPGQKPEPARNKPREERTYTRRRVVVGGATAMGAAVVWSAPWPFSDSLIGQTIDSAWAAGSTGTTGGSGGGGGGSTTTTTTSTTTGTTTTSTPPGSGPTAPGGLKGRFQHGALQLSWDAAISPGAAIATYDVLLDGTKLKSSAALSTAVKKFDKKGTSAFTVRAIDSVGKIGPVSSAVKVVPIARPTTAPRTIPSWAYELAAWQGKPIKTRGARPETPVPVPQWFWAWKAWHLEPYKLA